MRTRTLSLRLSLLAAFNSFAPAASAVSIDWITVGDPGNACDVQSQGCFGAVADTYRISKTEATNSQYAEFLNAVAAADPNALYSTNMGSSPFGGITQSGASGSFSYSVNSGFADKPVNFVSFYDSLRFANWLHNGQPTGAQGSTTTEGGAYTITAAGIAANSIARNAGATIFLTSEDEWGRVVEGARHALQGPLESPPSRWRSSLKGRRVCASRRRWSACSFSWPIGSPRRR